MRPLTCRLLLVLGGGMLGLSARPTAAQITPGHWSVKGAFGPVLFVEGSGSETTLSAGAAVSPRWSVEPELAYLYASPRESGVLVGVNLVRRLRTDEASFRPYLIAGLGFAFGSKDWSGDDAISPSLGLGAQLFLTPHLFFAPEVRVGYIPTARFTLAVGYSR